jgi:hypothetical protein
MCCNIVYSWWFILGPKRLCYLGPHRPAPDSHMSPHPKAIRMMRTSKLFQDYTYLDLDSFSKYCHLLHVLAEKPINDKSRDVRNSPGRQICRHHLSVLNVDNFHWCKYIFILKTLTTCAVRYMEECKLIQTTLFLSLHEKSYFFLKPLWIVCTLSGFNIL